MKLDSLKSKDSTSLKLNRILVPLDFSSISRQAVRYAVPLAEKFGARIVLLHVIERARYAVEYGCQTLDTRKAVRFAKDNLNKAADDLVPEELLALTMVRTGAPYREIISVAASLNVDLIVITTHGYTGLKHALLGSTAERVVRHAPCPVFTVRKR